MSSPTTVISDSDLIDGLDVWYLKLFGLWGIVNHYRITGRRSTVFKLQFAASIILNVPSLVCQGFLAYLMVRMDIQKFTIINSQGVPCLHMLIRHIVFCSRLGSLSRLYDLLRRDFLVTIPEDKRPETKKIYLRITTRSNLLVKTLLSVNVVVIALWLGFPRYPAAYIADQTGRLRYKIMGGWYPLPMNQSPYFELIFCYEAVMVTWIALMVAVYLCALYLPLICLSAHFRVLGYHISTLKAGRNNIYDDLYAILHDHRKLIRYADELRSVYNQMVTFILGVAIYMQVICVFQFLYGEIKDVMYILKFLQMLAYVVLEVAVFCYGSSFLEEASSELTLAVYSSEWYKADRKYRKMAQMLMIGASKGITLTAIKMYPVNLETMVEVFQFTYTTAALMSRMRE